MSERLDDLYLTWLYSQFGSVKLKQPHRTFWSLARQLFTREFTWFVPNDDNRVEDGRDLRVEFLRESGMHDVDPDWMGLECSFLEMLIGLSRRLAFEAEGEPREWFWHLMENMELDGHTDAYYGSRRTDRIVSRAMDRVVNRTYDPSGRGGLFPLENPPRDQTITELWYQLSAYLLEREA